MPTEYALFDILIREASQGSYTVDVRSPLGGDASGTFAPPFDNPRYQQLNDQLQRLKTNEDGLAELGQILFDALFQGKLKDIYTRSQGGLKENQGLRLRFDIDPVLAEVAGLPWEFLYDPDQGPLAMLDISIVRYLSQQAANAALAAPLPMKVLVTGAVTPPQIDVERELAEVRAALSDLAQTGQVAITVEEHLTRAKLQRRLREGFQIWHFIGHGGLSHDGASGTLLLEDPTGSAEPISARELGIFLNRSGVRLIMLDACDSAKLTTDPYRTIAPALIRAQVPAVIAMQFTVPEEATRAFAGEFYRTLAAGFPIDACVTEGRKAVVGATGLRNPDWGIPVVYSRAPDGRLFDKPASQSQTSTPAHAQSSGVNISIGQGNQLNDTTIQVDNVGNDITSGTPTSSTEAKDDENAEQIAYLQDLVYQKKRRLQQLKLQAARYGINTPPEIATEIEDLEGYKDYRGNLLRPGEIAKLERELKQLTTS
jgi:hypothetical protein